MSAKHVVIAGGGFGGYYTAKALERTLTALEPYLLQLRIELGAANA